jgi:hypothetical protein
MKTRLILYFLVLLLSGVSFGQDTNSIKVYFLHGSKPASGHKKTEPYLFGGKHGGHVSIGIDTAIVSFTNYDGFHIFPHREEIKGVFIYESLQGFLRDTANRKYTIFKVPLSDSQYVKLKKIVDSYSYGQAPYDYAFFGMRCASAAYDILSQINLFKRKSTFGNIVSNFYPKLFRKKMLQLAKKNRYPVKTQKGCKSRKWECD